MKKIRILDKMQAQEASLTHVSVSTQKMQPSSSRILYDIPCKVCRDHSSGKHYGIFACDGCAGFFKRSIRRSRQYHCKAKAEGGCTVDKTHRNQCRACRLSKCIQAGMNKDAVQHERGPRNSTLRRQMAMYLKEPEVINTLVPPTPAAAAAAAAALDLALPKSPLDHRIQPPIAPPGAAPHHHHHHHHHHRHPHSMPHPIYAHASINMCKIPMTPPGIPIMPAITPEPVCEQAAQILFINVRWARDLTSGSGLSIDDQLTLLEASWRELFLLTAAQILPNLDPTPLLPPRSQSLSLAFQVNRFRETLLSFHAMNLSAHEYACIKAIVLFKAGLDCEALPSSPSSNGSSSPNNSGSFGKLRDPATVARLRDNFQLALGHQLSTIAYGTLRFGKILLLLPTLKCITPGTIEELFFRRTIGVIPMERIICDMYKSP
ncbi:nuclear receptor subfamily 2 group E member 1 [Leptopilina boulardi]|uniref:nuclear receptor subfamily 2 group E member 1 n=1 Tax=Leptopilina boulardi TaxID=63433 RepID=UPI0021F665BE|nr:nuclear receptor subfamily 2 group E member 1 [Leptopilina boulardi]